MPALHFIQVGIKMDSWSRPTVPVMDPHRHVYEVKNGRRKRLHHVARLDSLGAYYGYVTHICGVKAGKHEGKITGLAALIKSRILIPFTGL